MFTKEKKGNEKKEREKLQLKYTKWLHRVNLQNILTSCKCNYTYAKTLLFL